MKNKIILDLSKSEYKVKGPEYIFYFSSETNRKKFLDQVVSYIHNEKFYLNNRYNFVNIDIDDYLTFAFYKRIEKRGFRVETVDGIKVGEDFCFLLELYDPKGTHYEEGD